MVFEVLQEGRENAMTGKEICALLHIKPRDLTIAITKERREGKPICASCGEYAGYFIAANRAEMERYCKGLYHRAGEIFKTRRACLNTIENLPAGQGADDGSQKEQHSDQQ